LDELPARLHTERERGYTVATEEVEIGLTSVGVTIRNHASGLVAVVNISGPTFRLITRVDEVAHRLRAAAIGLETSLAQPYRRTTGGVGFPVLDVVADLSDEDLHRAEGP
jgi:IclR family acetate operon transcriptional repressor